MDHDEQDQDGTGVVGLAYHFVERLRDSRWAQERENMSLAIASFIEAHQKFEDALQAMHDTASEEMTLTDRAIIRRLAASIAEMSAALDSIHAETMLSTVLFARELAGLPSPKEQALDDLHRYVQQEWWEKAPNKQHVDFEGRSEFMQIIAPVAKKTEILLHNLGMDAYFCDDVAYQHALDAFPDAQRVIADQMITACVIRSYLTPALMEMHQDLSDSLRGRGTGGVDR